MILGFSHAVQLSVFFKAIGAGYALGLLFSFFMFLNIFSGKSSFSVFIRDILFFAAGAIFSFLFILKYNSGIVRFYILAGELMGFCLFYIFPGKSISVLWKSLFLRLRPQYFRIKEKVSRVKKKHTEAIGRKKRKKAFDSRTDKKEKAKKQRNKKKRKRVTGPKNKAGILKKHKKIYKKC